MGTAVKTFITICLVPLLAACSSPNAVQPASPLTAHPTGTATTTVTQTPPAAPPGEASAVEPASEWSGIPIMPGAIAGEGDEEGYVFTIRATTVQVQAYYQSELGERGWQLSSQEAGSSFMNLIFTNGASETLTVSILSKGEEALVLLVK